MHLRRSWNYFIKSYSYFHRQPYCYGHPGVQTIELTNRCIMDCRMCPRQQMTRETGDMAFDLYARIVDQMRPFTNRKETCLHGIGESLLHPELGRFIAYAAQKGIKTLISTNPICLNQRTIQTLLDSGLDHLMISLDGTNPETYRNLRGPKADYKDAQRRIDAFLAAKSRRRTAKPYTEISMIRVKETEKEIETFKRRWRIAGVDRVLIKTFKTWDGSCENIISLATDSQYSQAFRHPTPYPCIRPWLTVNILWDGRVVPCCYDYDGKMVVGDLTKQSLKEVWNDTRMLALRQGLMAGDCSDNPLCARCRERQGASASKLYPLDLFAKMREIGWEKINVFVNSKVT